MAKYRPVPRTLSDILSKLSPSPPPAELLDPEQLKRTGRVKMLPPDELLAALPHPPEPLPPEPELRTPEQLFGKQAYATPGQPMKSLSEILPKPEIRPPRRPHEESRPDPGTR